MFALIIEDLRGDDSSRWEFILWQSGRRQLVNLEYLNFDVISRYGSKT